MSLKTTPPATPKDQIAEPTPATVPAPSPVKEPAPAATIKSPTDAAFDNLVFEGDDETSEKPAATIKTPTPTPKPGEETDPNDPAATTITTEVDPNAPVLMFGDESIPVTAAAPAAAETPAEKHLREQNEALNARIKELEATNPAAVVQEPLVKPDLYAPGIDGDQEKHEAALEQFYEQRALIKVQTQQAEQVQQAAQTLNESIRNQAAQKMDQQMRAALTTFPDMLQADEALGNAFTSSQSHAMAFLDADLPNPEMVAYALYKKPELLAQYLKEQNPVRLGKFLTDISAKVRLAPKAAAPEVNNAPEVKGSIGLSVDDAFAKEFPGAKFE